MNLKELFKEIDEKKMGKPELEQYHSKLSYLNAQFFLELADLEKEEAIFMHDKKDGQKVNDREIDWKASVSGLRMIDVKNFIRALGKMLKSLEKRIYEFL